MAYRGFRGRPKKRGGAAQPEVTALRMPQAGEVVGTVTRLMGAAKFAVRCSDGRERLCSIPGRFKRMFWIKEGDAVIVKMWSLQSDERGDVIWRYSMMDKDKLRTMKLI